MDPKEANASAVQQQMLYSNNNCIRSVGVPGFTYSLVNFVSFPSSVGMAPTRLLQQRSLPKRGPERGVRSVVANWALTRKARTLLSNTHRLVHGSLVPCRCMQFVYPTVSIIVVPVVGSVKLRGPSGGRAPTSVTRTHGRSRT